MLSNPNSQGILGTGQIIIPVGTRSFNIGVVSGSAWVGGTQYWAGQTLAWQASDAKLYLGATLAVGVTGVGNKTTVFYA